VYDSGNARFAITTSVNTDLAVARALKRADLTANKQVFLADFVSTTREIIASLEKQTSEKFAIMHKDTAPDIRVLREMYDAGEFDAAFPFLAMSFGGDSDIGYDSEKEQELWNQKLGLQKIGLDEVVKEAIELAKRT
jgi:hypothetical protein